MKSLKHFLIFKIIGIIGAIATISGIILAIVGFGDFESKKFIIGGLIATVGVIFTTLGIVIGFAPEIARARAKTIKYIQEENKEDLTAIANNNAEIMSGALATTASAISDGVRKTMFCKHCGAEIDVNSNFCSSCGKKQ